MANYLTPTDNWYTQTYTTTGVTGGGFVPIGTPYWGDSRQYQQYQQQLNISAALSAANAAYAAKQEETMKMPHWIVTDEKGIVVAHEEDEKSARRTARLYASNNKVVTYILKPTVVVEPKDVPVEETELS